MKFSNEELKFKGIVIDAYHKDYQNKDKTMRIEQVIHPGGVCIAAQKNDGSFLMVKQYRFGIEQDLLEFPAGLIDPNEDPKNSALRELQEETGYQAKHIESLGHLFLSPGYSNEITYLYFAKELEYVGTNFDENEDITQVEKTLDELIFLSDTHQIQDAKTLALIYKLQRLNQR